MRPYRIPYAGIYGACSTMGLGLIMAAAAAESGFARRALCAASSHFCAAERQYRFPLEYGCQRPPTAQWTVTAAGACIVETVRAADDDPRGSDNAQSRMNAQSREGSEQSDRSDVCYRPLKPRISAARIGRITDYGIADQNNMGAAMAPADVKMGT